MSVGAHAIVLDARALNHLLPAIASLAAGVAIGARLEAGDGADGAPERFAAAMRDAMQPRVRIVGGARGTTPDHIRALAESVRSRAAA